MPMGIRSVQAAGEVHPNPWLGPIDHTVAIRIDVSTLTTAEVDTRGFLKPGVLFRRNGTPAGAQTGEQEVYITGGAAGTLAVSGIAVGDQLLEVTYFVGAGTTVTNVSDLTAEFTINGAGTINNTAGTATTGGKLRVRFRSAANAATDYIFGAVVEAVKIATGNTSPILAAAADVDVALAVYGVLNKKILEDSLGRSLTANELAAVLAPGCRLVLAY